MAERIQDPHGLVDRDIRNFDVRYRTMVDDYVLDIRTAVEIRRIETEWYTLSNGGQPPAEGDLEHGKWRAHEEYNKWVTLRTAWADAWPLSEDLQPLRPSPPVGSLRRLIPQGHYFIKDGGERFTAICATDFNLQKILCDGGDPRPAIRQRRDCGFNMLRTFTVGDWGDPLYRCRPDEHPDYYDRLADLCAILRDESMYWNPVIFCDTPRIFPTDAQQQDHYARSIDVYLRFADHVLPELVNENNVPVNTLNPAAFARPSGILASHGSNGSQSLAVRPWWDWEAFHTNQAPEEQRKIGHNAMELSAGTPDWPASHVPTITNETSRYPEVGMWTFRPPDLNQLDYQKQLAYDSAAGAALQCAGSCFHSVNGKLSRLWDGNEIAVAIAWASGARSVPLEFQSGHYRRNDNNLTPGYPGVMRRYQRVLPDGRFHEVPIRW